MAALAEAQTKYAAGGEAAVWQKEKEQRALRGSVRAHTHNSYQQLVLRDCSTVYELLVCCAQVERP